MNILVFAGTSEGRILIKELLAMKEVFVCACVATEYGKEILEHQPSEKLEIKAGRLSQGEMQQLMGRGFDLVVDATHPYATVVTENIKESCDKTNTKYIRLLREKTEFGTDCIFVESTEAAVEYLNPTEGNILLTTGSKELEKYTKLHNYQDRIYTRVLPMEEVVRNCNELGFTGKHLICMQGPFSCDMNRAMLNQLECRYMVTKDTGKAGGAYEKYQAAKEAEAILVVVGRTEQNEGMSLKQVIKEIESNAEETYIGEWFPMFINLKNKDITVIGAGKIAGRRIKTLLQFSCNLKIIAKEISEEIKKSSEDAAYKSKSKGLNRSIELLEKEFDTEDIIGADIVLAATNNRNLNEYIGKYCRERGITVNVADAKEECDFYFPGVVMQRELIVGITAQGKSHSLAKRGSEIIRNALSDLK
ncbi:precorrin-6A reductase [Aminipila sp.]|uniref:precorrin-6A reductase n=1 Tax=Aminipila sp. TaxID=2060095 RepID=UPI00289A391E|nr:precorrin-6A reductase [Aminipila sp.]